jgi:hypothetical protein
MAALSDNGIEQIKSCEEAWLWIREELLYCAQGAISERFDEGKLSLPLNNRQCRKFPSENNLTRCV